MIEYVTSFEFTSFLAVFVYWIPALVCATVYLFRGINAYRTDLQNCTERFYHPKLTVGMIIWHLIVVVTPCINLLAMVFDCAGSVFKWLGRVFDFPLVRHQPEGRE